MTVHTSSNKTNAKKLASRYRAKGLTATVRRHSDGSCRVYVTRK